jgi:hypothetical protein
MNPTGCGRKFGLIHFCLLISAFFPPEAQPDVKESSKLAIISLGSFRREIDAATDGTMQWTAYSLPKNCYI